MANFRNCYIISKTVATFLTIVMLFSLISFSVYASDNVSLEEQKSTNGTITEIEDRRESNVKHFLLPDGSCEAIVYSDSVHRKDENGIWVDIDNRLFDNNNKAYVTEDERIFFSKKINSDNRNIFTLSDYGYKISFSFCDDNLKNVTAKLSNHPKKYIPNDDDTVAEQYKKLKTIDNTTTISYKNIKKNTTFEYEIKADYIKEKIILNSQSDEYLYNFILEVDGLEAYLENDGAVYLYDKKDNNLVYTFPIPFMYDDVGAISYDVHYDLEQIEKGIYQLSIEASDSWINDENRVFPVVIDPTIRQSTYLVYDTYTDSTNPTTNYGMTSQLWISSERTTYIRMNIPDLPNNAIIRSANLYTAFYYYNNVTDGKVDVGAYKVDAEWNEFDWTWALSEEYWNNGYSSIRWDTQTLNGNIDATVDSPQWVNFDITMIALEWYDGTSPNYGIALKYLSSSTNASVIIKSYEAERYNRAYFTVTYYTESSQILEDGVYWLSSKATRGESGNRRLMDVEGNSTSINTEIQQWDSSDPSDNKYRAQLFYVKYIGDGYYRIYTFSNPNLCLKLYVNAGVVTGDENTNPNYSKWSISGSSINGYTITNYVSDDYSITVPTSVTNGKALELSPKDENNGNRNRWDFNKFEGHVMSIVADPGTFGGGTAGTGHAFLMFENCSSSAAIIGYVTVVPGQTITVGTAGRFFGVSGGGSSSSGEAYEGIFYNREAYHFYESDYYQTRAALSILIDNEDLETINDNYLRNDEYNDWNLWLNEANNCAWFAMNVWNSVSDYSVNAYQGNGWGNNPWTLEDSIKEYSWYINQIEIPRSDWYGYVILSDNEKYFTYVQGNIGAFPTVPVN